MKKPLLLIKNMLFVAILFTLMSHPAIVTLLPAFAQSTGTISGRVTNSKTGVGISQAVVSAVGPSERAGTTDSQGNYTISGLAPGPYDVAASASGYVSESKSSFIYPSGNAPLDFILSMLSIRGIVYNASIPNQGIAEANITIGDHFILANSTGHYGWLDLLAGTYTMTASAPGYASQSKSVTVSTGVTRVEDFALGSIAPGGVSGAVKDSTTKQGLYLATVRISRGSFQKLVNTGQDGQYSMKNVPAWPYWTVDAYKTGYVAQSIVIAVGSGATATQNFDLVPFGIISGAVKDPASQPIAGALVKADSVFFNTTNSNGYYSIFVLAGTYTVTASAPGYVKSQSNIIVSEGKTTTANFVLQPVPPGRIVGLVTDAQTGYAIADAVVTADMYSNTTDVNGNYVLSNLPAWTYTVHVSASGFVNDSAPRTVSSGKSIRADFVLSPYTRIHLEPYLNFGNAGQSFNLRINISEARSVYSWETYLWWDPTLFDASEVIEGSFLKGPFGNRTTQLLNETYPNEGVIYVRGWSDLSTRDNGASGNGTLATITYHVKAEGICSIALTSAMLFDPNDSPIFPNAFEGALFRTLKGDVNNDGTVNNLDLVAYRLAYGSEPCDPNWNINVDADRDQIIGAHDLYHIGKDYGKST
jgi:hypothetical protein